MQEDHGGWQLVIIIDYKLQVGHSLISLVGQGRVLRTDAVLRVVHLIDDVRNMAQIQVEPSGILHSKVLYVLPAIVNSIALIAWLQSRRQASLVAVLRAHLQCCNHAQKRL